MSKITARIVYRRKDGKYVNRRIDSVNATSIHNTQKEAIEEARRLVKKQGGGELIIKGLDGKIRSKDTIAPGNDPCPPIDTEH